MWQYVLIDRGNESGNSLLVWVKYTGAWGKMKSLPNISAYVFLKDFTPDLIFLHRYISAKSVNFVTLCAVSHCWFDSCGGAWGKITQTS